MDELYYRIFERHEFSMIAPAVLLILCCFIVAMCIAMKEGKFRRLHLYLRAICLYFTPLNWDVAKRVAREQLESDRY